MAITALLIEAKFLSWNSIRKANKKPI